MLNARTGLPGHGKTLSTLSEVEEYRTNQTDDKGNPLPDREVFYFGINELKLNWLPLENPHKWYELPDNCIVVIDEAQEHFPVRSPKDKVPEYCSKFERHRHTGIDIFLITQDVRFLDHHVRRLVGNHKHIERKFGTETAVILSWEKTGDPDDYHSREKAEKAPYRYPKKYYSAYKSATIHTVKRKFPKILLLIPAIFLVIGLAIYFLYSTLLGGDSKQAEVLADSASSAFSVFSPSSTEAKKNYTFSQNQQPEINDIPQSAPFYKSLYKAKSYPKPVCIASEDRSRCICHSQQGTTMQVSLRYCLNLVDNGYFDPTISDKRDKNQRSERVSGGIKR